MIKYFLVFVISFFAYASPSFASYAFENNNMVISFTASDFSSCSSNLAFYIYGFQATDIDQEIPFWITNANGDVSSSFTFIQTNIDYTQPFSFSVPLQAVIDNFQVGGHLNYSINGTGCVINETMVVPDLTPQGNSINYSPTETLSAMTEPAINNVVELTNQTIVNYWPFFLVISIISILLYKFSDLVRVFTGKKK